MSLGKTVATKVEKKSAQPGFDTTMRGSMLPRGMLDENEDQSTVKQAN
jgi:hypothetical protein